MVVFYNGVVMFVFVVRFGGWVFGIVFVNIVYVFGNDSGGGGFICVVDVCYDEGLGDLICVKGVF